MPQNRSSFRRNPKRQRGLAFPALTVSPASCLGIAVLLCWAVLGPAARANDPPTTPTPRGSADVHFPLPVAAPEHLPILARVEKLETKDALRVNFTTWHIVVEVSGDQPVERYRAVQGIQDFELKRADCRLKDIQGKRLQADRIPKTGLAVLVFGDGGISRSANRCFSPEMCVIRVRRLPPLRPQQAPRYESLAPADVPPSLPP